MAEPFEEREGDATQTARVAPPVRPASLSGALVKVATDSCRPGADIHAPRAKWSLSSSRNCPLCPMAPSQH